MARFAQTTTKVSQMMEIAFDLSATVEKRETATSNLLVLAKEAAGIFACLIILLLNYLSNSVFFSYLLPRSRIVGQGRNIRKDQFPVEKGD